MPVPDYCGDGRTVTVLAEPRPDEPQRIAAVVRADHEARSGLTRHTAEIVRFKRERKIHAWWCVDCFAVCGWDDLIDPVILSPGWTPEADQ